MVDGLHAKIDSINTKDQTVVVDADGIYLTFSRMAVRQILPSVDSEKEEKPVVDTAKDEEKTEKEENSNSDATNNVDDSKE